MDFKQAVEYMKKHTYYYAEQVKPGVEVTVKFSRRMRTRWGTCNPVSKVITYNLKWVDLNRDNQEAMRALTVHECCHLRFLYHNRDFELLCQKFGVKSRRTMRAVEGINGIKPKCVAVCPRCGHRHTRHNRPRRRASCGGCSSYFNEKYELHYRREE